MNGGMDGWMEEGRDGGREGWRREGWRKGGMEEGRIKHQNSIQLFNPI